jgi:hypothetical protein
MKMEFQEMTCGGVDWIQLAQNNVRWQALLNPVINLWILKKVEIS